MLRGTGPGTFPVRLFALRVDATAPSGGEDTSVQLEAEQELGIIAWQHHSITQENKAQSGCHLLHLIYSYIHPIRSRGRLGRFLITSITE